MRSANPYLNFPGDTEDVFSFYKSVFGGEFILVVRYRDFPDNPMKVPEEDLDKVAHMALWLGENILMGTDALASLGHEVTMGNNFFITLNPESAEEADAVFNALSDGGSVEMPLTQTEWAEKYGMCTDKYGVQWMVSYEGSVKFDLGTKG